MCVGSISATTGVTKKAEPVIAKPDRYPAGAFGRVEGALTFFVNYVGFSVLDTIKCATLGGAKMMGRANELGSLEKGKLADVLVVEGDVITPHYDPMIAKLIVWGEDRAQALARLDAALAQTHIVGPHSNAAFLRRVAASAAFTRADLDTGLIERERATLFGASPLPLSLVAAGVAAHALALERADETADPWSRRDGWRLHGAAQRRIEIEHAGVRQCLVLERHRDGTMHLLVDGRRHDFDASAARPPQHDVRLDGRSLTLAVYASGERVAVFAPEGGALVREVDAAAHAGDEAVGGGLGAPMPGKVVAVLARAGERVRRGQPLAVIEAMKMEHTLSAPSDGVVTGLRFAAGAQVAEGEALIDFEPAPQ